ncbi:epimerase, partial [Xanthomonas oryzae pv. oryzae]
WWAIPLVSPVVPLARALREVRQLWSNPLRLRNTRLLEILGEEPHTPPDAAVEATLTGSGCLPTPLSAPAH